MKVSYFHCSTSLTHQPPVLQSHSGSLFLPPRQAQNREKSSPTALLLPLPVVPHVGETDTDTLTEIPDRLDSEEDEFGYSWSKFTALDVMKGRKGTVFMRILRLDGVVVI